MSRYNIPTISAANADLATSAELGKENQFFYSNEDVGYLGKVAQDAEDLGTFTSDPAYAAPADYTEGHDLQVMARTALRSPGGPLTAVFDVTLAGAAITSSTSASPGVITTPVAHGLVNGDKVTIAGVTGTGATVLNGVGRTVTVISPTTFSAGINTTGAGTGGYFMKQTTATATFEPPSHVADQANELPASIALDLIPDGADSAKKIRTVDGLDSVTSGDAGNVLEIYHLPDNWIELGCVEDANVTLASREGIRIPCRGQAARWTKLGRETDPGITIATKYQGFAEGIMRINGFRTTLKIEVRKDERLLTERMVFLDTITTLALDKPDGNGVVMARGTAIFANALVFV